MSSTTVQSSLAAGGERQFRLNVFNFRVPQPVYRHAAPSAPWPWMNFDIDANDVWPVPAGPLGDAEWCLYPQSLFRNWTSEQVKRSQMLTKCDNCKVSTVYKIGCFNDGKFDEHMETRIVRKDDTDSLWAYWVRLKIPPPSNMRVQALFVKDMTLPLLQMLGTKYKVEPFFFASSVNWIPSRYREDPRALKDHITVVLPFIRILKRPHPITRAKRIPSSTSTESSGVVEAILPYTAAEGKQIIDTQAPLSLPENKILIQDLLSLHMVRKTTTSTIISYHPSLQETSAERLQFLVRRTGNSIYWSKIFERSRDPTFLFLAILWYALYAWDEAFEVLFRYISVLEHEVLKSYDIKLTRELHRLQAHLLYYEQLLRDFLLSVEFVRDTPNPAMNDASISDAARKDSAKLLRTEADNLISEIKRLTRQREMMFDRLNNAIHLTFATVNIMDSRAMQGLAELTVKDSATMKQLAYLTMIFLPATYIANVFSMNVRELFDLNDDNPPPKETLANYIKGVICLTVLTSWIAIALQKDSTVHRNGNGALRRALWPLFRTYDAMSNVKEWLMSANRRSSSSFSIR